jgi:four helix bundle protein
MKIESYQDLTVWQKAMDFAELSYLVSRRFPSEERFGLTTQLRRAAVSIAANIAEGNGSGVTKRYIYHLAIARGSLREAETHLLLAQRLGYLPSRPRKALALADEISRMITTLKRKLREKV